MDPNTQQPIQNPTQQTGSQSVQQPARQPVQPVAQPVAPVGGKKEAVIGLPQSQEWVSSSSPEVMLPKEVENAGVESQTAIPQVPPSAQVVGVTHAKEATPVSPVKMEPLNMQTQRSVLDQLKAVHKSVKDSFSWLVRLIIKEQDKKEKGASL